jgi:hypothetical protein
MIRFMVACIAFLAAAAPPPHAPPPHAPRGHAATSSDARDAVPPDLPPATVQYHVFSVRLSGVRVQYRVGAVQLRTRSRRRCRIHLGTFDASAARSLCMPHLAMLAALSTTPCFRLSPGDTLSLAAELCLRPVACPDCASGAASGCEADSARFIVELVDASGTALAAIDTARASKADTARREGDAGIPVAAARELLFIASDGPASSGIVALRVRTVIAGCEGSIPVCRRDTLLPVRPAAQRRGAQRRGAQRRGAQRRGAQIRGVPGSPSGNGARAPEEGRRLHQETTIGSFARYRMK